MKPPPPKRHIDWDEALRLHAEEGWPYVRIAREFGYAAKTVRNALSARGASPHKVPRDTSPAGKALYSVWITMRSKCRDPRNTSYAWVGARGIGVCKEWDSFQAFERWARGLRYRPGLYIDRIRATRGFSPANCRWITLEEARRNGRRKTAERARERDARGDGRSVRAKRRVDRSRLPRLLQGGLSYSEVARRMGVSDSAVRWNARKLGIAAVSRSSRTPTPEAARIYKTWHRIVRACTDPSFPAYRLYGARGVGLCRAWRSFESFLDAALASGSRPGLCLTRIERSRGFSPENCAWLTREETGRRIQPPRQPTRARWLVEAFGERKGPAAWSRDPRCQVSQPTLIRRLRAGERPEEAISDPPRQASGGTPKHLVTAFGVTKCLMDWTRDRRCKVGSTGLSMRLASGWSAEVAIATPAHPGPGAPALAKPKVADRKSVGHGRQR